MKPLTTQPSLTEQVYQTLLEGICDGSLAPGSHLVQEQIAAQLRVSRQPIQQALAVLKSEGLLLELGRRGLFVAPLDIAAMKYRYEIRAALDGLAAHRAARRAASALSFAREFDREGRALIEAGNAAVAKGSIATMVRRDVEFHAYIYSCSGNPLVSATVEPLWRHLRRVMSEVLRHAEPPQEIWRQHAAILAAIVRGDGAEAEALAVSHVKQAGERLEAALSREPQSTAADAEAKFASRRSRSSRTRTGA